MRAKIDIEGSLGVDPNVGGTSPDVISGELMKNSAPSRVRLAAGRAVARTQPGLEIVRQGGTVALERARPGLEIVQETTHRVAERVKAAGAHTCDAVEPRLVSTVTSVGRGTATASNRVVVVAAHRTQSRQERARYRRAGGRVPHRAWLLWVFLGPLGAHRFYLRSWVAGVKRALTTLCCWIASVVALTQVLPGLMVGLLPDALNTGISTFAVAPWAPQLALVATGQALRSGVTIILVVVIASLVLLMLPSFLWLVDAFWIGRNLRRRNTQAGHVIAAQDSLAATLGTPEPEHRAALMSRLFELREAGLLTAPEFDAKSHALALTRG
jgi:TM2 domain-containing membrane protein YozV